MTAALDNLQIMQDAGLDGGQPDAHWLSVFRQAKRVSNWSPGGSGGGGYILLTSSSKTAYLLVQ